MIAFGAVEDWSTATFEAGLFVLAAGVAWSRKDLFRRPSLLWAPALFLCVLLAAGVLQVVPVTTSLWRTLGDERGVQMDQAAQAETFLRSDLYRTDPFSGKISPPDSGSALTPPNSSWRPATFTPALTLRALLALMAALVLVLLMDMVGRSSRDGLRVLALVVGVLGLGVGFVALAQYRSVVTKILGMRESAHATGAFGPFVNENNGMGFVNLAMGMLYYFLWRRAVRSKPQHLSNRLGLGLLALCLLVFHACLLGIRTTGAGYWPLLLFPGAIVLHALRHRPRLVLIAGGALALALAGVAVVGLAYRFTDLHGRLGIWTDTLSQNHWLVGNGLGSFGERFQAVLTDLPSRAVAWFIYPENEYLQLYFEAGLPGAAAALFAALYVLVLGWKALMAEGHAFLLVPPLWGEALHAVTDFHFHLWPVVAAYLVLIALIRTSLARNGRTNGRANGHGKRRSADHESQAPSSSRTEAALYP